MKKIVLILALIFVRSVNAQITAVTTSGQYDTEIFDLNSISPSSGIPVIFCFTVPTTFDGDSITVFTFPINTSKSLFFKGTYEEETLRLKVRPGETVVLPPAKFYYLQRFCFLRSNDPASGNDIFSIYAGNYREK